MKFFSNLFCSQPMECPHSPDANPPHTAAQYNTSAAPGHTTPRRPTNNQSRCGPLGCQSLRSRLSKLFGNVPIVNSLEMCPLGVVLSLGCALKRSPAVRAKRQDASQPAALRSAPWELVSVY